jgi:hypothetical protein
MLRTWKSAWLLCGLLGLASCAKDEAARRLPLPADEATSEERAAIDATLTRIEGLTVELGHPHAFRDLPVILTTDDRTYTDHPAGCVSVDGAPQFILVKRTVLLNEARIAEGGAESTLFRVLLHEIGHCYFHRSHEEAHISQDGEMIELTVGEDGAGSHLDYAVLDATVMVPETLTLPVALEKYYVAELLGLARAKSLEDLAPFAPSLKFVPLETLR